MSNKNWTLFKFRIIVLKLLKIYGKISLAKGCLTMNQSDINYQNYVNALKNELVPAMGCTEPIAIAYCAATAFKNLGENCARVLIEASGNIIKNVKSVTVPNTDGLKGIEAAAAAGIVAGDADKKLEVISQVSKEQKENIHSFLKSVPITVKPLDSVIPLDLIVTLHSESHSVSVRIAGGHDHILWIKKDGELIFDGKTISESSTVDHSFMRVKDIIDFANCVNLEDVKETLDRQISYNMAIAQKGITESYGANIGKILLERNPDNLLNKAKAYAADGSDARMSGCELPVIINSGSGNQGMTASIPVIVWAKEKNLSSEKLYRALLISNLITMHLKYGIGKLSAYCGVVSAGVGAACGICYLEGGDLHAISHTLVNGIAMISGTVCDGAKPSCAAKIASALEAGYLGYEMYKNGQQFKDGEGIVTKGVENTIRNISLLAKEGMKETDKEIIEIMTGNRC